VGFGFDVVLAGFVFGVCVILVLLYGDFDSLTIFFGIWCFLRLGIKLCYYGCGF